MTRTLEATYDGTSLQFSEPLGLEPNTAVRVTIETQDNANALTDEAWRLYDEKLKALLEPQFLGQVVAIDLDTGDYEVAKRSALAWRPLRVRRPDARIVVLDIGPVSPYDSLELRRSGVLTGRSASE